MEGRVRSPVPSRLGGSQGVVTQLGTPGSDSEDAQAAANSSLYSGVCTACWNCQRHKDL